MNMKAGVYPFDRGTPGLWLGLLLALAVSSVASGQRSPQAFELALAGDFQAQFVGATLRETLDRLSKEVGIPYWLDRRVDSNQNVKVPNAGPTVEDAFFAVATASELVSLPIDGLVLVGRQEWVDTTGALILANAGGSAIGNAKTIGVSWPMLVTPTEAIATIEQAMQRTPSGFKLPHDLWPAFTAEQTSGPTLLTIVGCQFDRWLRINAAGELGEGIVPDQVAVEQDYPTARVDRLRAEITQLDPEVELTVDKNRTRVRSHARVHRLLQRSARPPTRTASRRPHDAASADSNARFTIRWQNAPARAALETLAQAGQWKLEIHPDATPQCAQRIELDAMDQPLNVLMQRVADQVGVRLRWEGPRVLVLPSS